MNEKSASLVSIIILNYNAGKLLHECVESVFKSHNKNFEVILVDNASSDKTYKQCKEKFNGITLLENKKNLGYCEGNNVGIRHAQGEFIVVLNPDTLVEPDWLDKLISAYEKNGDGIYQPKILANTDHSMLLSTGQVLQLFGFGYSRGKGDKDTGKYNKLEKISYASGTCLFTTKKILEKLNFFDPFLFAYHDDLDLCWRAAMIGINSFYVPTSIIYHPIEGYSFKWSSFKFYLM
ncbi:MAG TPA: glycosyltransferase family 2 protein, partial [Candidatus Dadabacteria bacterium]|nr:glycosyltransferase family 2 protein [Candidatus Dadabacteria bacterium]